MVIHDWYFNDHFTDLTQQIKQQVIVWKELVADWLVNKAFVSSFNSAVKVVFSLSQ